MGRDAVRIRRSRAGIVLLTAAIIGLTAGRAVAMGLDVTTSRFCGYAQQVVAATQLGAANRVHDDYVEFMASRPQVEPLETQQYVLYEDDRRTVPLRVSCKMSTPDHLTDEYGAGAVGAPPASCLDLHRAIVTEVYESLSVEERVRLRFTPDQILLDADEKTVLGATWISPYDFASLDAGGALHLRSKALRIDWGDMWWSWAPASMRGLYYCHVIAPEYLRRLVMGDQGIPRAPAPVEDPG